MTEPRPIVLFGTGGVARVIRYVLDHDSPYRVVAFTVDRARLDSADGDGLPVVAFDEVAERYPPSTYGMFVALGFSRMNSLRASRYAEATQLGYELVSHVSERTSTWPGFETRPNTIVMEDCTIGPEAEIGEDCIIWPRVYVGHGARIGAHCYVAANASISGLTRVGERSVIGSAAVVRDDIEVGAGCLVGVGAVLTANLESGAAIAAPLPRRLPGSGDRLPNL